MTGYTKLLILRRPVRLIRRILAVEQKKEMLLAKLRKELVIPDQRHEALRGMIEDGRELKER